MGEIDLRIESLNARETSAIEPPIPDVSGPAVTRGRDLWLIGRHKLLCGDARSEAAHAELTPEAFTEFLTVALERMKESRHPGSPRLHLHGLAAHRRTARPRAVEFAGHAQPLRLDEAERRHGQPLSIATRTGVRVQTLIGPPSQQYPVGCLRPEPHQTLGLCRRPCVSRREKRDTSPPCIRRSSRRPWWQTQSST